ncbi:MAG: hypothetical protein J6S60_09765 [Oscillospiraceae bacterium]|nr:hypothetical protein [Oscillospiraceae bacterium]
MAGKTYRARIVPNPTFQTVRGLTNRTFDPENIVADRGATEDQLLAVYNRHQELSDWIDQNMCHNNQDAVVQVLRDRLDALEDRLGNCYLGAGAATACNDNEIQVSFEWNGADPITDGGTASALAADQERPAVYYWFLIHDSANDVYFKSRVAHGGDYMWTIDDSGTVTAEPGVCGNIGRAVIAVDAQGCEGMVLITLPTASIGG